MNALETALYGLLAGDATLTGMLAHGAQSIWEAPAPEGTTTYPYVVFQEVPMAGDTYSFKRRVLEAVKYQVKGLTESPAAAPSTLLSGQISDRLEALLMDAQLTLSTGSLIYSRRDSRIKYPEILAGTVVHHQGGIYRFEVAY